MPRTVTTTAVDPFTSLATGQLPRVRQIASHADALAALRPPEPATDTEEVPIEKSVAAILDWVGHDVERAKATLVAEALRRGQDNMRSTLVGPLNERITG